MEAADTTAKDAMAAAATDTTAAGEVAVDMTEKWPRRLPWRRKRPHWTHSLRRKAQARVSLCQAGEGQRGDRSLSRQRTGRRDWRQNHLRIAAARSRW